MGRLTIPEGESVTTIYQKWLENGKPKDWRFGQWLYNTYCEDGKPWPELFYASTIPLAVGILEDEMWD